MMFLHRLCFMLARSVMFITIPAGILILGGKLQTAKSIFEIALNLVAVLVISILPIMLFKYVFRVKCPHCGDRLDREVIGSGNYDCHSCGQSYS